jgi:hypothetical protein
MREFRGLPPDPNEVQYLDNGYMQQIFKWSAIVRFVEDAPKRKREYGA